MTWSSFVSLYGEEPNPAWIVGLKDIDDQTLMAGYERARAAGLEWPPNLSVFIDFCNDNQNWEARRLHKPYDPHAEICDRSAGNRYLPPAEDTRTVDEIRAELREAVGLPALREDE